MNAEPDYEEFVVAEHFTEPVTHTPDFGPCPHTESLGRLHREWLAEVMDLRTELKESEDERARLVNEVTELRQALYERISVDEGEP